MVHDFGDMQKDLLHFKGLIGDLIGILGKSISFCIHSGESVNDLLKHYLNKEERYDVDSPVLIQETLDIHQSEIEANNDDSTGIDYIRFTNSGVVYSLPKRIINSLEGSFILEQSGDDQRTIDGSIYLDYPYDDSCAPLLVDSLMNKKIDLSHYDYVNKLDLLQMFEFCEVPLPEELVSTYERRSTKQKKYNKGDSVTLYINDEKDTIVSGYLVQNDLWDRFIMAYNNGYVDYNHMDDSLFISTKYQYIEYIHEYIKTKSLDIPTEKVCNINKEIFKKEMFSLFSFEGQEAALEGILSFKCFPDTKILINKVIEAPLGIWFGENKKWKLLYRASEHEYSASEFHKYCDNKGETVTLIKYLGYNNFINIIGGYTNQNWSGEKDKKNNEDQSSSTSIFTLCNENEMPPTRYLVSDLFSNGISCDPLLGPCFGNNDIHISDKCRFCLDSYYNASTFKSQNSPRKSFLFSTLDSKSLSHIIIDDYEVFGVDTDTHV
ncbi:hypothetical protein WA158_003188 [Blastocystis sp. Blastoise]